MEEHQNKISSRNEESDSMTTTDQEGNQSQDAARTRSHKVEAMMMEQLIES